MNETPKRLIINSDSQSARKVVESRIGGRQILVTGQALQRVESIKFPISDVPFKSPIQMEE
jgi:hypothetical protein